MQGTVQRNLLHRLGDACAGVVRLLIAALGYGLGFITGLLVTLILWVVASVVAGYQAGRLR
jgi:hypothetical protein